MISSRSGGQRIFEPPIIIDQPDFGRSGVRQQRGFQFGRFRKILQYFMPRAIGQHPLLPAVAVLIGARQRRRRTGDVSIVDKNHARTRRENPVQPPQKSWQIALRDMRPPESGECRVVERCRGRQRICIGNTKAHPGRIHRLGSRNGERLLVDVERIDPGRVTRNIWGPVPGATGDLAVAADMDVIIGVIAVVGWILAQIFGKKKGDPSQQEESPPPTGTTLDPRDELRKFFEELEKSAKPQAPPPPLPLPAPTLGAQLFLHAIRLPPNAWLIDKKYLA